MAATVAVALLAVGYPVAIVVIARWLPVVRRRRGSWFWAHAAAVVAIIAGWAIRRPAAALPNVVWLVVSTLWYRWGAPTPEQERGPRDR